MCTMNLTASYYTHTVSASILVLLIMDKILISTILFTVYTMLMGLEEVRYSACVPQCICSSEMLQLCWIISFLFFLNQQVQLLKGFQYTASLHHSQGLSLTYSLTLEEED